MKAALMLQPRMSEKSYGLSETIGTYVFEVPRTANKREIAQAVAVQYKVNVAKVTIASTAGKNRRVVKRGGRTVDKGRSAAVRKAYVKLVEGDKLPIFASVPKDEEADIKPESKKADKTAPKAEAKQLADSKESAKAVSKPEKRGRRFGLNIRGNR